MSRFQTKITHHIKTQDLKLNLKKSIAANTEMTEILDLGLSNSHYENVSITIYKK